MPAEPVYSGQWRIGGVHTATLWIAGVGTVGFTVTAATMSVLSLLHDQPPWALVLVAAVWLVIGLPLAELFLRSVVRVVVHPDGGIEFHRLVGTVRTHARRVTGVGLSVWDEERSRKPVVVRTADGNVRLASGFRGVPDVVAAIRAHNPDVPVAI